MFGIAENVMVSQSIKLHVFAKTVVVGSIQITISDTTPAQHYANMW